MILDSYATILKLFFQKYLYYSYTPTLYWVSPAITKDLSQEYDGFIVIHGDYFVLHWL